MARNSKAGKHPSYNKRKMTKASRDKKLAYDKEFQKDKKQVKKRMQTNKHRAKLKKEGKDVTGKDVSHVKGKLRLKTVKANRGSKSDSAGDKRARG